MSNISLAETDAQIAATHAVMFQLRPHLPLAEYLPLVRRMMGEGYRLAALTDDAGEVRAVAGFRRQTQLYCENLLVLDDLVTDERVRSQGYGKALLDWLKAEARRQGCTELHLLSKTTRAEAHRFYFREGFWIECFHFRTRV